nr:hypothetical protein [Paraburkholderia phytofirmans]
MYTMNNSLRLMVEKWLSPSSTMPARVARFGRMSSNRLRYVCVEALRPTGPLALYFFLHDDGKWRVFPPDVARPAMGVSSVSR